MWIPMASPQSIGGQLGVLVNADILSHYHYAEQLLFEAQSGWLISIEPLEVKVGLTRIIYDDAMHADRLGRRLGELRVSPRARRAPDRAFLQFAEEVARAARTTERLTATFAVLKPALIRAYRQHLTLTDPLLDAPTHLLLKSLIEEEEGHVAWGIATLNSLKSKGSEPGQFEAAYRRFQDLLESSQPLTEPTEPSGEDDPALEHLPTSPQPIEVQAPIRDSRFSVVDTATMPGLPPVAPETIVEYCHFYINTEMAAAEMCARTIVEFPDLPWELRLDLARQCWDEGRHCEQFCRRVTELGGHLGMRPFNNWLYDYIARWPDPLQRLIALNRILEGNAIDGVTNLQIRLEELGDRVTAQIMEYIVADETVHTRISNWIERLTAGDPDRQRALRTWHAQRERERRQHTIQGQSPKTKSAGTTRPGY